MGVNETVHQLQIQLWDITYARYINQELFSYQWWGMVTMLVVFYTVWWKLVDKRRLMEILLFGSFVAVMDAFIDIAGATRAYWQYNIRLFPVLPAPFPFDFTTIPILLMLAYQYCSSWTKYLIGSLLGSVIQFFVFAPIFVAIGTRSYYDWRPSYSFILMMAVALIAKYAVALVVRAVEASKSTARPAERFDALFQPTAKPSPNMEEDNKEKPD